MPVKIEDSNYDMGVAPATDDSSEEEIMIRKKTRKTLKSDSEAEGTENELVHPSVSESHAKDISKKRTRILPEDSSEDDGITSQTISTVQDLSSAVNSSSQISGTTTLFTSEGALESSEPAKDFRQIFANKDLYDAEDSDDDVQKPNIVIGKNNFENYDAEGSSDEEKSVVQEKRPKSSKHPSSKRKSHEPAVKSISSQKKEPKDELDKIHSESQRLVRRSRVSLPYHKPRQRSLAEFLQRRPSVPARSLRMSADQLKMLAKQMEERAKEAEEFYKSSSDEEKVDKSDVKEEKVSKVDNEKDQELVERNSLELGDKNELESSGKELGEKSNRELCGDSLCKLGSKTDEKEHLCGNERDNKNVLVMEAGLEMNKLTEGETKSVSFLESEQFTEHQEKEICLKEVSNDKSYINNNAKDIEAPNGATAVESISADVPACAPFNFFKSVPQSFITGTKSFDKNIGCKHDLKEKIKPSFMFTSDDTQSAVDFEKLSPIKSYSQNPLHDLRDLDSQNIHLRIDNTETWDLVDEQTTNTGPSISKAFKNVLSSNDAKNELLLNDKNDACVSSNVNLEATSNNVESQSCLQLENTGLHSKNEESFPKFTLFAVPMQETAPKNNKPSKAVAVDSMGCDSISIYEIGSQDLCLRLENSETLDSTNEKCESAAVISLQNKENRVLNFKEPVSVSSETAKKPENNRNNIAFKTSDIVTLCSSSLLENTNSIETVHHNISVNSLTDVSQPKLPAKRNLSEQFTESETNTKVTENSDSVLPEVGTGEVNAKTAEDPVLILEGDETRISFDQDDSVLLSHKADLCTSSSEKVSTSDGKTPRVNEIESKTEKEVNADCHKTKGDVRMDLNASVSFSESSTPKTPLEEKLLMTRQSLKLKKEVPCLKGSPSKVIDLDDTPSSSDINTLKKRFLRHSLPIVHVPKKNKDISVVTAVEKENGEVEVKKEYVMVDNELENLVGTRSKLIELKKELQKQIVKEREQEWSKRQLESQTSALELEPDEKSNCELFAEDDEEEEDVLESESESEEEEEEGEVEDFNETRLKKGVFKKNAFVDDEAEVSDDECDEMEESDLEENDEGPDNCVNNQPEDCDTKSHPLKDDQKLDEFGDDSASGNTKGLLTCDLGDSPSSLRRMKTLELFASQESVNKFGNLDTSELGESQIEEDEDGELDISLGIPPYQPGGAVTQVSDVASEDLPAVLPRKEKCNDTRVFSQFPGSSSTLGGLCIQDSLNETDNDESELLGLCSGKFSSQLEPVSQDDNIFSSKLVNSFSSGTSFTQKHISVEEESENTQISFMSKLKDDEDKEVATTVRRKLVESDCEEEAVYSQKQKKTYKQIQYSDDEEEDDVDKILEASDDELIKEDEENLVELQYDSEENEIPVTMSAAKDFFENEAELSESEWGSADEDEKGLDDFEEEDGDNEKLDQKAVKEQLDKIHMRRMLDEDQQEIKRLQEMLLEDGEFHSESGGRQRQFRWKNLGNLDDLNLGRRSDDEGGDAEEEEDESEWRRLRFQRESFLQEHKDSIVKEEIFSASSIALKMKHMTPVQKKTNGQVKRGSFLTRSETALARIALLARTTENPVLQPKNSRNFVFATLSQGPNESEKNTSKRKAAAVDTPVAKKRIKVHSKGISLLEKIG